MAVRPIGSWKDAVRRLLDAIVATPIPGGARVAPVLALVDGYLYPHEAAFLYGVARHASGTGAIVEIGSFRGRSTICMALGCRDRGGGRVYAVDPHVYGTEGDLRENIAHFAVGDLVEVVVGESAEVASSWSRPLAAVLVDGEHSEDAVDRDVASWLPLLAPGGLLLLHDATDLAPFPGPRAVALRRVVHGDAFDAVGTVGSLVWGRVRGAPAGTWAPAPWYAAPLDAVLRRVKGRLRQPA